MANMLRVLVGWPHVASARYVTPMKAGAHFTMSTFACPPSMWVARESMPTADSQGVCAEKVPNVNSEPHSPRVTPAADSKMQDKGIQVNKEELGGTRTAAKAATQAGVAVKQCSTAPPPPSALPTLASNTAAGKAPVGEGSAPAKASRGAPPPPPPPPPKKPSSRAAAAPATPSPSPKKPSSRGAAPPTPPPPPPKKPASRGAAPPTPPPPPPKKPASRGAAPPTPPPPPPKKPSSRGAAPPTPPPPPPKKPSSRGAAPPTPPPPPPKKPASRGAAPPTPPPPPPKKPSSRGAAAPPPLPMPPSKKAPPSAPPPPPKKGGRGGPPAPPPPPGRKKMGPPAPPKNASSGQVNELPLTRRAFYKAIPDPKQGSHWSAAQLPELSAEDQRLCAEAFAASKPPVSKLQAPGKRVAPQSKAAVTDAPLLRCAEIVARQLIKPQAFPTPGHLLRALASNELDEEQVSCLKQLVRKMWAPECSSAMQGLKACKTPVEELMPTEALLYTLASVDRLPQMMATLELRRDFAALEATAAAKQSRVAEAHRRILESKRLEPSLQRVLVSGRFLNRGLESGKAKALAISSLPSLLRDTKVAHPSKLPYAMANLGEFMGYVLHKDLSTKGVSYSKGILSDELGDLESAVGDIAGGRQDAVRAISLKLPAAHDLLAHYQKLVQAGDIPLPAAEAPAAQHGSSRPALASVEPGRLGSNITPVGQASGAAADQENHLTPTPGLYQLFLSHSEGLVASASAAEAKLRSEAAEIAEAEKQVLTRLGEKCEPDEIRQTFAALAEYITLIDAAYAKAAAESQRSQEKQRSPEKQPESAKEDAQAEITKLIRSGIAKYRFDTDDEAESSEAEGSC